MRDPFGDFWQGPVRSVANPTSTLRMFIGLRGTIDAVPDRGTVRWGGVRQVDLDMRSKHCSFCGEPGDPETRRVAGGLGAFICEHCVAHHHSVLWDEDVYRSRMTEDALPWMRMSTTELLAVIPLISQTSAQVDAFLVEWIELARSRGISWAEIGKVLGVSRQAAWERFARRVERLREAEAERRDLTAGA